MGRLTGSVDLTQLPEILKYLYLGSNLLSVTIDLTHLPYRILELSFANIW